MATDPPGATRFSLRRWSRRKLEAARSNDPGPSSFSERSALASEGGAGAASAAVAGASGEAAALAGSASETTTRGNAAAQQTPSVALDPAAARQPESAVALPPIESLTSDSDFSPFLRPGIDEGVKRSALRKLFRDPRFNVMDGLDVYIDDYTKPSPIEPELVRELMQARYIFDPPRTRVNAQGHVEDVADEAAPQPDAAPAPAEADAARGDAAPESAPGGPDVAPEPKAS
jgi:hypothetical protein